jgi:hypothetical protein
MTPRQYLLAAATLDHWAAVALVAEQPRHAARLMAQAEEYRMAAERMRRAVRYA